MEIRTQSDAWDAIVIGSGANGGVAAQKLTEGGLRVLVLEAGRPVEGRADYGVPAANVGRQLYRHFVSRRQAVQELHATYWTTHPDFFVDDVDNPYTTPKDKPFRWIRGRSFGGRTHTWDGVTPRMSDCEFKAASRDGIGIDWPIGHADLAPYYSELERLLGVHGSRDGLPQLPDGDYLAPQPFTPAEAIFKERTERVFKDRHVLISRGIGAGRRPARSEPYSRLSSPATTFRAAEMTGRLTIRTNAVVSRIVTDAGRATGVEFVDARTHKTEEVRAKLVFLCASTIESVRILLHSESSAHPQGIGASSGVLGHYLMDHVAGNLYFYLPDVRDDGQSYELLGSDAILVPRYQNLGPTREDYSRGFGLWGGIQRIPVPSFLRKKPGLAFGFLCARAEVLPHFDNRVELDGEVRDAWGIPAAHIVCEWKEPDLVAARGARQGAIEMIEAAGGKIEELTDLVHTPIVGGFLKSMQKEWAQSTPGLFVHELGGARMGTSPKDSVVDSYGRCWEVPNLFVTDGACWPSGGWQNPTLTEMAITARACDHAIAEMKRLNL
jgi:choline dehydrogenase-like flavoprotein